MPMNFFRFIWNDMFDSIIFKQFTFFVNVYSEKKSIFAKWVRKISQISIWNYKFVKLKRKNINVFENVETKNVTSKQFMAAK